MDKYVQAVGGAAAFGKLTTRVSKGTIEFVTEERTGTGNFEIYSVDSREIERWKLLSIWVRLGGKKVFWP